MTLNCARCGIAQEDLPETTLPNEEVVQRFRIYDGQRDLYICGPCEDMFYALLRLADQYPLLAEVPELRDELMDKVPLGELEFFKKLLPGGKL
jgi:hypothetical protein